MVLKTVLYCFYKLQLRKYISFKNISGLEKNSKMQIEDKKESNMKYMVPIMEQWN